ncbi:hypothetical protein AAKU52_003466 [Pedobacter sp. CG_S7]|uniref:hypothetical protein n=1 Tax=Pedobacter sp. CG_S7 TaxID=3143930 RepID=UPI0033960A4E
MQDRKDYTEKLFTSFQLSSRIPRGNLYPDTKELYGKTGNPSFDPVVHGLSENGRMIVIQIVDSHIRV